MFVKSSGRSLVACPLPIHAGNDPAKVSTLVKAYEDLLGKSLQEKIPALVDKAIAIKLDLERADTFGLIPNHPPWDYGSLWVFLGVLTSAMLLSLGAPFWFNMLKTASNLRPAIAAYVEDREPTDLDLDDVVGKRIIETSLARPHLRPKRLKCADQPLCVAHNVRE